MKKLIALLIAALMAVTARAIARTMPKRSEFRRVPREAWHAS